VTNHDHHQPADDYSQATWDARYSESARIWSGNPNQRLVEQVADLAPGDALDVGAGEGADAVWLASRGWQVTALDVSPVALAKVVQHAAESGVADRVRTIEHDLIANPIVPGEHDLVTAHFWHPPAENRTASVLGLAAGVRPGGALLIVGHHTHDLDSGARQAHDHADKFFTPEQITTALPDELWEVRVAETQDRAVPGPDGPVTLTDSVVLAVRR